MNKNNLYILKSKNNIASQFWKKKCYIALVLCELLKTINFYFNCRFKTLSTFATSFQPSKFCSSSPPSSSAASFSCFVTTSFTSLFVFSLVYNAASINWIINYKNWYCFLYGRAVANIYQLTQSVIPAAVQLLLMKI